MSDEKNVSTSGSGGIGISGVLGVVFVVLKLVGVITWKWIWVLAPFWISISLAILFIMIAFVIAAILNK